MISHLENSKSFAEVSVINASADPENEEPEL
jgi:hypothetical protein